VDAPVAGAVLFRDEMAEFFYDDEGRKRMTYGSHMSFSNRMDLVAWFR
jgi:hypothetical protein